MYFILLSYIAGGKSVVKLHGQSGKPAKQPPQKKDGGPMMSSAALSETKGGDGPPEKDRKKDVPAPRMQFDDKNRVEKAKKRALVKKIEARNRVELFRHLPQYEQGTQLPDLESRFFHLDTMHPAVYKVTSSNPSFPIFICFCFNLGNHFKK